MQHVKKWWDSQIKWTLYTIFEKYSDITHGFKIECGFQKKINAYIMHINDIPFGYIQYYDVFDFKQSYKNDDNLDISFLPKNCAGVDLYIGEADFINIGFRTKILIAFVQEYIQHKFTYIFITPNINNLAAHRMYEKVGFKKLVHPNS